MTFAADLPCGFKQSGKSERQEHRRQKHRGQESGDGKGKGVAAAPVNR